MPNYGRHGGDGGSKIQTKNMALNAELRRTKALNAVTEN